MRKLVMVIVACVAMTIAVSVKAQKTPESVDGATAIDATMAKALLDNGAKFIDVRPLKFWEAGRIPGAVSLDLFDGFNEKNLLKIASKNDEIVIYCEGFG